MLENLQSDWEAPDATLGETLDFLQNENVLFKAEFSSAKYRPIIRYIKGKPSRLELGLSLQRNSFLSHRTALFVHGIAKSNEIVYANREQSPKNFDGEVTQAGIDAAFRNKQRESNYAFSYAGTLYVLLSGKYTGRAGVRELHAPSGERISVTDLERTLIDIVVRPAYAGGIESVAEAYRQWASRIDLDHMLNLLRSFQYAYPYHQAIGFLLQRAGRPDCQKFMALGMDFDFYLDYKMHQPAFSEDWRLYYPRSLDRSSATS
jgi:hypothetical protein